MNWALLAITVASFVYTWYVKSRSTNVAQQIQQVTGPTAAEGISIPVLFGERTIPNPNVTWYGGQETTVNEDKSVSYKIALQMALCHGKLDSLEAIYVAEADDNNFLTAPVTEDNIVNVYNQQMDDAPRAVEGAFTGKLRVRLGAIRTAGTDEGVLTSQDYANKAMGFARGPRYHGVAMVESMEPMYIGKSPQIAGVAYRAKRIHTRKGGSEPQWYDEKAEIQLGRNIDDTWKYMLVAASDTTEYVAADYDDSAWPDGRGGFGNASYDTLVWQYITDEARKYPVPVVKTQLRPEDWSGLILPGPVNTTGVTVAPGARLWIRGDLGALPKQDLGVKCWHDDAGFLWFNGTPVELVPTVDPSNPQLAHFNSTATIPASLVSTTGPNVVAFCARDGYKDFSGTGNRIGTSQFIFGGVQVGLDVSNPRRTSDMNPVHIIREVLTDDIWGPGYADAIMGDSFTATADTCYSEKLGLSFLWDEQKSYKDFLEDIQRYISGYLYVDPITGKYEIKLVREDYDVEDLPVFDGTNTTTITDIERQSVGELVNQITATYSNTPRGKQGSVTVGMTWLIDEQGGIVNNKVDYPAVSTSFIAGRLAMRDLRILSAPLLSATVGANRDAIDLRPGSAFVLNRSDVGISNVIMRVSEIDFGDGIKNECTIKALEDVFYFPAAPTVSYNPPIAIQPPTVKIATATDEYDTTLVVDVRNMGWVECVYKTTYFEAAGWVETSPGVLEWDLDESMPVWQLGFDGVEPDVYSGGGSWLLGRRVLLPAEGSPSSATRKLAGVWIFDSLGGYWDGYGTPGQTWVWTNARMHRDPAFATSDAFVADMIFSIRAGTTYGGRFQQLATANVVLGETEQTWNDLASVTWSDSYRLLKVRELSTQNVATDSSLRVSATVTNGAANLGGFQTLVGTPGVTSIPAGAWKIRPSIAGLDGASEGSTTVMGFAVYRNHDGGTSLLFQVISEPITASRAFPSYVPEIVYVAPEIPMEQADQLTLVPNVQTTSTTAVTLDLYFNNAYAVHVNVPRQVATNTAPIKPDEAWYLVTVVDGIISGFGDHRRLRVRGTGPLVGIATTGLVGGVGLALSFVEGMDVTVNGSPSGAAPLKNAEGQSAHADKGSVLQVYLMTDDGTSAYWRVA